MSPLSPYPSSTFPHLLTTPGFQTTLFSYHLFPLHMPITLFLMDAPFGRFNSASSTQSESSSDNKSKSENKSRNKSRNKSKSIWQLNGNFAWFIMELVSPLTFLSTGLLTHIPFSSLSTPTKISIFAFLIHYLHRAVISPLVLAPKRSPQHVIVTISSIAFNLVNGFLMSRFLWSDPLSEQAMGSWRFWIAMGAWLVGFVGNGACKIIITDPRDVGSQGPRAVCGRFLCRRFHIC